jgi:uncharacterized protein
VSRVPAMKGAPTRPAASAPSCTLVLKATPNAPRTELAGWLGETLKVKVQAPPVEGRANAALCVFLAQALGLHPRDVTVLRGDTARLKQVRIEGRSRNELEARLPR